MDDILISELNTLVGIKPTTSNSYNWMDCNYYISSSTTSFMFYQDIDYDNNGTYDYRGIYFTQYRPNHCTSSSTTSNTYQDDNNYLTNTIYWFSYDPIEWLILDEYKGKALIFANLLLDSQEYYSRTSSNKLNHNAGNGYANNYELSNIRKYLNETFYNTAFNDLEKELIEKTAANNSNIYECKNTNDKVFLLSRGEATKYFNSSTERQTQ